MYKDNFYISTSVWNNALSFDKRLNKKLYVPSLIEAWINEIELWNEVVFEDFDFDNNLISAKGLKNFYKINWFGKNIYLFDNHNHAFYFWYLSRNEWIIWNENILYHVDEHSDMRKPEKFILKDEAKDISKVFEYTNFELNVGNYIIPAIEEWILKEVIQVRNKQNLEDYDFFKNQKDIILNLDLDFFEPNLDYIDYQLKKKVILDIAKKAKVITVATSPFFINQDLAIRVFSDLFSNN